MDKKEYIKKIKDLLDNGPFYDEEIDRWNEKMPKMTDQELEELLKLLEERERILSQTDDIFFEIAKEVEKKLEVPPKSVSFKDLSIDDLVNIFKGKLVDLLNNDKINLFKELDDYFVTSKSLGRNAVEEIDSLINAVANNKEVLVASSKSTKKNTIEEWVAAYNVFKDSRTRGSMDRINFVSADDNAKKLSEEDKHILLKLLKLYDFLLNPESLNTSFNEKEDKPKIHEPLAPPKLKEETELDNLQKMAENYPLGTLERRAIEDEIRKLKLNIRYQNIKDDKK